jgi:hypothetical protein
MKFVSEHESVILAAIYRTVQHNLIFSKPANDISGGIVLVTFLLESAHWEE